MANIAIDGDLVDGTLSGRIVRSIVVAGFVVICVAILWITYYWSQKIALEEIRERSGHTLNLVVTNLQSELSKFQYQPPLFYRLLNTQRLDQVFADTNNS